MRRKTALFQKIHQLEASSHRPLDYVREEFLCADGKAQIDIRLYDGLELFDPLSMGRQKELNGDIYAFIDAKLYAIPTHLPIRLCFHGALPGGTQQEVRALLQEHYLSVLRDKRLDLRINRIKIVSLALLGVALLALYFALELFISEALFMELLSIAGSFAIWEAVDCWLLERKSMDLEYLYAGQAALSEITFVDD